MRAYLAKKIHAVLYFGVNLQSTCVRAACFLPQDERREVVTTLNFTIHASARLARVRQEKAWAWRLERLATLIE